MPFVLNLLYLFVLALLAPWLLWRVVRTGRYRKHLDAKLFGRVEVTNPERKPLAWFHAVSVGEVHLLGTVVAAFRKRHPDWHIAISSTTDTGLAEALARFPDCSVIAYPFDFTWACANALKAVNPRIILLAESEMWPNFLAAAARRKVPVVLFNARQSPRSFGRLKKIAGLARYLLFRHVRLFAVQSQEYAERFKLLGVPGEKLIVTGSVKYDGATGDKDSPKAKELARLLNWKDEIVWVCGSTHAPEEEIVLGVFERLRGMQVPPHPPRSAATSPSGGEVGKPTHITTGEGKPTFITSPPEGEVAAQRRVGGSLPFPELRLILVPRHPDRFDEVAGILEKKSVAFVRRSHSFRAGSVSDGIQNTVADASGSPRVVLLDTVGELGAAWSLADIGFVGGSLALHRGGQSMIEPAGYGVPTLFGPHVWNFRDAANRLIEAGGALMVKDAADLEATMMELLADPARRTEMGEKAKALVQAQQGATERTLDAIEAVLHRQ